MTSRFISFCLRPVLYSGSAAARPSKSSNSDGPNRRGSYSRGQHHAPQLCWSRRRVSSSRKTNSPSGWSSQNATTNGVRPLTYTFEVAADSGFGTKVFSRSGVAPGGDGKTSVQIDRLDIGRAYYWRAWAEDGANTGAMATAGFEIFPKAGGEPAGRDRPRQQRDRRRRRRRRSRCRTPRFVGPVGWLGV